MRKPELGIELNKIFGCLIMYDVQNAIQLNEKIRVLFNSISASSSGASIISLANIAIIFVAMNVSTRKHMCH